MTDLKKAQRIIEKALKELNKKLGGVEPSFNKSIIDWINKFDISGGNISNNQTNQDRLLSFQKNLKKFLLEAGYSEMVSKFIVNFDELQDNQKELQLTLNGIKLNDKFLNPYKKWAINNVIAGMEGQGLDVNLVTPLQNQLFTTVNQGGSLKDLIASVEAMIITNEERAGLLRKNAIQVSRDALGQYNGVVNEAVRSVYNLDGILYVGTLVKDSRPQCERWVGYETYGIQGLIPFSELQKEIDWALDNGTGFIKETTPETFNQFRGGYNCRHEAYPVRLSNYKPK